MRSRRGGYDPTHCSVSEEIPEELILKAALAAAAQALAPDRAAQAGCCEPDTAKPKCCTPQK